MSIHDTKLVGAGGLMGGGKSGEDDDNTTRSTAKAKILFLLGEGPIKGIVGGKKGLYLDDTPALTNRGKNFKGVSLYQRLGWPDQKVLHGFKGVETTIDTGAPVVKKNDPRSATVSDGDATSVRVTIRVPALVKQTDEGMKTFKVKFKIEVAPQGSAQWKKFTGKDIVLEGKWTSPTDFDYETRLPNTDVPNPGPWTVRVTRMSDDEEEVENQNDIVFFSVTSIIDEDFTYPNSALAGLVIDAEDFGASMPQVGFVVEGRLIKVPSNYDPATRTYTGVWDGTFKTEYCNNPAWVFYDLITNKRYGLGRKGEGVRADKWILYQIAQVCDEMVPNGRGGLEPRFEINTVIREKKDAYELMQLIASAFRGMSYWGSAGVTATQDTISDPVAIINETNVINGEFINQSSSLNARHTVAHVKYYDARDDYREALAVYRNARGIQKYGEKIKKVDGFGCTSRAAAMRLAKWIVLSDLHETQLYRYQAGKDHVARRPGDIVMKPEEEVDEEKLGGRIIATSADLTEITLDREFVKAAGKNYLITLVRPSGDLMEASITAAENVGDVTKVTLAAALPEKPVDGSLWLIYDTIVTPKLFRILNIAKKEKHTFEVNVLEVWPEKYALIDDQPDLSEPKYRDETFTEKPAVLEAREYWYAEDGIARAGIMLGWSRPPNEPAARFDIQIDGPGENRDAHVRGHRSNSLDIKRTRAGTYTFTVVTRGLKSRSSEPMTITFEAQGRNGWPKVQVLDLALDENEAGTVWKGRDCTIAWKNAFGPLSGKANNRAFYDHTKVKVYDEVTDTLLRAFEMRGERYTYDFRKNREDNDKHARGPARHLRFELVNVDAMGRESDAVVLSVSNPAPAAPSYTVTQRGPTMQVNIARSTDEDIDGYLVWLSKTSGFTPNGTTEGAGNCVHDGGRHPQIDVERGKDYFVICAAYDAFGKAELNYSAQLHTKAGTTVSSSDAPAMPTNLLVSTTADKDNQGHWRSKVIWDWDDNAEEFFDHYEIVIEEEGEKFDSGKLPESRRTIRAKAQSSYRAKVRACDGVGNKSPFTDWATIVAAKKTGKPNKPTNLRKKNGNRRSRHTWDKSPDEDHKRTAVWVKNTNVPPNPATDLPTDYTAGTHYDVDVDPPEEKYVFFAHQDTGGEFSDVVNGDGVIVSVPLTEADVDLTDFRGEIDAQVTAVTDQVAADIAAMQTAYDAQIAAIHAEIDSIEVGEGGAMLGDTIDRLRALTEEVRKASTHSMFQGAFSYTERKEIIATQDDDRAAFTQQIDVIVADAAALAQRTTTLEAETADLSAGLETIETAMTTADQALAAQITTLNATLGDKAEATAVQALETRVTDTEGDITSLSSAVTALNSVMEGKAEASAVNALTTTVTEIDGNVTAVATALTELTAGTTPGDTATARMRMLASSAPSGWSARLGFQVRGGAGDTYQSAGLYMDVAPGQSRVVIEANKFMILTSNGALSPFSVSGNTVTMTNVQMAAAYITGQLTASQISVGSLSAISGTLGNVDISSANIGSLTVGTLNIAGNAITVSAEAETGATFANATALTQIGSVTMNWGSVAPQNVTVFWQFKSMENMTYDVVVKFNGVQIGLMRRVRGGAELPTCGFSLGTVSGTGGTFSVHIQRVETGANTEIRMCAIIVEAKKR